MTRRMHTTWRWLTTVATIAAAALAMSATIAAPAHATATGVGYDYECTFANQQPSYIGWATLSFRGCIAPGMAMTADCRGADAYRWTGASWQYYGLNECSRIGQVYVYPYAAGWSWIWTQRTGWLAVRSNLVLVSSGYLVGGATTPSTGHTGH